MACLCTESKHRWVGSGVLKERYPEGRETAKLPVQDQLRKLHLHAPLISGWMDQSKVMMMTSAAAAVANSKTQSAQLGKSSRLNWQNLLSLNQPSGKSRYTVSPTADILHQVPVASLPADEQLRHVHLLLHNQLIYSK